MIRVVLPSHLRALAHVRGDVELEVAGPVTQRAVPFERRRQCANAGIADAQGFAALRIPLALEQTGSEQLDFDGVAARPSRRAPDFAQAAAVNPLQGKASDRRIRAHLRRVAKCFVDGVQCDAMRCASAAPTVKA